ncbi:MAG TPA: Ppx/GppA phosphatase family protein [Chthonomonas sp.]|jgi:exopolyphosphatase/guanosine-5'-triphosphate,3'-diphosphate pyrophosphatase|uniref:Ppx/GppA phosphatase family protein n=1 Tax=Chthonomonas sp. TaxID=2282153 RepID=UPI002B4AF37A|nr:Ppx/GppA phosphatase family protein [Chthonomonas sp.]HLH80420.1 Ppx/GppA phosphatase family protein [Chthonomonas sp.]
MSHVFAAIDIGTNSIRLAVVRIEDDNHITTLAQHREMVRLGEGEFATHRMTPEAIDRGALVCARFADVARGFGADEIVAFATAAVREAENREEFIERVRREAGIEVRVISGPEEARLIWLGVSSGIELGSKRALLIDIGGGSTEVIVGTSEGHEVLESMKLGAIRLSNLFFDTPDPVSPELFAKVQAHVRAVANPVARRVQQAGFDLVLGSAGTINCLGQVVANYTGNVEASQKLTSSSSLRGGITFRTADLREVVKLLCRLPLEERRQVPGMDPARADIILGGAAILLTFLEQVEAERITTSERGLREGILVDHLLRQEGTREQFQTLSVRRRSILQLARACNYEADHAHHTAFLALRLFDELRRLGEHSYGNTSRELLEYAAILHDIGTFLSHSNHQRHAYYIIRNSDLLGFDDTEIDIIANVALYHRKGIPKKKHPNMADLNREERRRVRVLAALLRVAEGLDRSHLGLVRDIRLRREESPRRFVLTLISDAECELEVWGVQNNSDLFEYVFKAPLVAEVAHPNSLALAPSAPASASVAESSGAVPDRSPEA